MEIATKSRIRVSQSLFILAYSNCQGRQQHLRCQELRTEARKYVRLGQLLVQRNKLPQERTRRYSIRMFVSQISDIGYISIIRLPPYLFRSKHYISICRLVSSLNWEDYTLFIIFGKIKLQLNYACINIFLAMSLEFGCTLFYYKLLYQVLYRSCRSKSLS